MPASTCLKAEDVDDYTAGVLSGEGAERVRAHLEQCDACRKLVEEGTVHERLLAQLRDALGHEEVARAEGRGSVGGMEGPRGLKPAARGEPQNRGASPGGSGPAGESDRLKTGPTNEPPMSVAMPKSIGQFHIKRLIATGGMGTVYEAVQEHPRRTVAVKVMKHGIASRSAMRRFEYESQILGRLRHPGIAQVYEAGTHDDGSGAVPYFAMEYIAGARPITDWAKLRKLSTRERLRLFTHVCKAVHHGHQKGIIHRDLKPGNILVDSRGEVKIIDFGVARATDSDMTLATLQTEVGRLIGTLQYMSPEQCEADPHDLDTRSDVYALGVVLYELLCEKPPYDLSSVTVFEAARLIREQQPTRISATDKTLRGDVETVVLKALEKDRERRFQSADELRRDIDHYLTGRPISARPPTVSYQLKLFARRNKALVGGVAVVLLVLVAGIIVSTWLYRQAEGARADTARINTFLNEMLGSVDPLQLYTFSESGSDAYRTPIPTDSLGRDASVEDLMSWAAPRIEDTFGDKPKLEAKLRETIGTVLYGLGEYEDARLQLETAWNICRTQFGDDHPDTLRSQVKLGNVLREMGKEADAEPLLRSALERMQRALGAEDRLTLTCARVLAMTLYRQEKFDEAKAMFRRTLEVQQGVLGADDRETLATMCEWSVVLLFLADRHNEAEELVSKAWDMSRHTLNKEDYIRILSEMLMGHVELGRAEYAKAESLLRPALEKCRLILGDKHPKTCLAMQGLARSLDRKGTPEEQEQLFRDALNGFRATLGDEHVYTVHAMVSLGEFLKGCHRFDEAEALCREILESASRTAGEERGPTSRLLLWLASSLLDQHRLDEGEELLRRAVEVAAHAYGEGQGQTLNIIMSAGGIFHDIGELEKAREFNEQAIDAGARWVERGDATARDLNNYAWLLLACNLKDLRDPKAALPLAERSVKMDGGENPDYLDTLAMAYHMTGDNKRAIETQQKAIAAFPSADSEARCELEVNMVRLFLHEGNRQGAEQFLREATDGRREKLGEKNPVLAQRLIYAAMLLSDMGAYGLAEPLLLEAHVEMKDNPQAPEIQKREALQRIIDLYEDWGQPERAAQWRAELATTQPTPAPSN